MASSNGRRSPGEPSDARTDSFTTALAPPSDDRTESFTTALAPPSTVDVDGADIPRFEDEDTSDMPTPQPRRNDADYWQSSTNSNRHSIGPPSRTHAPSVTPRGFLAPMSSQKLQAHRAPRPSSYIYSRPRFEENPHLEEDAESKRNSMGSQLTSQGPFADTSQQENVPPSRGTDTTEWTNYDRTMDYVHGDDSSVQQSTDNWERQQETAQPLENDTHEKQNEAFERKSPKGIIENWKRSSKLSSGTRRQGRADGHAKLPSGTASSDSRDKDLEKQAKEPDLGRNWEYFTGNTIFFWGGRIQNARERPMNILTGLIMVIPSILFFVYSAPFLWHHVSPAVPIFYAYVFFLTFSSYLHGSIVNPGVSRLCLLWPY